MSCGKIIARYASLYVGLLAAAACGAAGCQNEVAVSEQRLVSHQAVTSRTGLQPALRVDSVQVRIAIPEGWRKTPVLRDPLFVDEQWRSPTRHSAVGVFHCQFPIPLSLEAVAWVLWREVSRQTQDAELISKRKDALSRLCFEGEDARFHVWGFLIVHGRSVWIAYYGYRLSDPPEWDDLRLAAQSADGAVPLFDSPAPPTVKSADTEADAAWG